MAGMCKKCGHVVNELNSDGLCPTCASYNKKAEEDRKKKESEEQKKKIWDSLTEEERAEWRKNEAEAAKERVRGFTRFVKRVFVLAVIVLLIGGGLKVFGNLTDSAKFYGWAFDRTAKKFDAATDDVIFDHEIVEGSSITLNGLVKKYSEEGEISLSIAGDKTTKISKNFVGDESRYEFKFAGKAAGELSGRNFIVSVKNDETVEYDLTDKKVYYPTSADQAPLLEQLWSYLPANVCAVHTYDRTKAIDTGNDEMMVMLYREGKDVAYMGDNFLEKYDDAIYVFRTEDKFGPAKIPDLSDFTEIR